MIKIKLGTRKKKVPARSAKEAAARIARRERIMNDPRFIKGARPDGSVTNPEGHNQHTHPKGAKLITNAVEDLFINDVAPDVVCREAGVSSGSTWAVCIANQLALRAACGSLEHAQFLQDCSEKKMSGPGSQTAVAVLNPIRFIGVDKK